MVGVINPPKTGPNTLAAYKNASSLVRANVSPTSAAGFGGNLTEGNGTATTPNSPSASTGAASHLAGSAAFAGLSGFFAYLLI